MSRRSGRLVAMFAFALLPCASVHATVLIATNPVRNAKAAARTTNVQATADSNIQSSSVTQSTFRIQGEQTGRIAGTYSTSGTTFSLDPTNDLKPGELIRVSATSGIQNTSAVALTPQVWQFTAATALSTGVMRAHPVTPSFGGGNSYGAALGDLDGDGDLDAVLANHFNDTNGVWLNDGSGNFSAHPTTPTFGSAANHVAVALGDLDGDADLDAIVVSNAGKTVWLNDGIGNFTAHPTTPSFGAGETSYDVALGDLDRDGDLDAVIANNQTLYESVWLNDGTGSFTAHPTTPTFNPGSYTNGVDLGDLDGDGDLDVFLAQGSISGGAEAVFLNDGGGNFTAHPTVPTFGGGTSMDAVLGDLDGDGDLDAVVANFYSAGTVWMNGGSGDFSAHPTTPTLAGGSQQDLALGDIDGDGDLDVLFADLNAAGTRVWLNDGAGAFTTHPTTPSFGAGPMSADLALGDLDGDGDLDTLVANDGADTVWLNTAIRVTPLSVTTTESGGTGTFTVVLEAQPSANVTMQIDTSDNTEGRLSTDGITQQDSVTLTFTNANWSSPQTVTVHGQNDSVDEGNIAYTITTNAATSSDPLFSNVNPSDVSATNTDDDTAGVSVTPTAVTVAESGTTATFDVALTSEPLGDVRIDMASGDTSEATISHSQVTFTNADWSTPQTITVTGVGDVYDDGDVTSTIALTTNQVWTNDPAYDAVNPPDVTVTTNDDDIGVFSTSPASNAIDIPRNTIIEATAPDPINGATVTQSTFPVRSEQSGRINGAYSTSGSLFWLDPTSDLKPGEVVHATVTNSVQTGSAVPLGPHVWQFTAETSTASGAMVPHPVNPSFHILDTYGVALGDLDDDGDLDAVTANWADVAERVWMNDGTGNFTAHPTTPSFGAGFSGDVALGDLDGDGDLDAIVANWWNAAETIWLNDGNGNLSAPVSNASFGAGESMKVALGDIDGDGDLDAVIANDYVGPETVWLNNGSAVFTAHPSIPSFGLGHSWSVVLGDIDNDGDLDAVVANREAEAETVWLNDGSGRFTAHPTAPTFGAGSYSYGLALGDVDGDGDLDAVVANGNGQADTVWMNDGTGVFTSSTSFGTGEGRDIALGDIDGDGDLDAVVANYSSEAETVWLNTGGAFSAHPSYPSFGGSNSLCLALGDIDGDGDLDTFVGNGTGEAETVWVNRPAAGVVITPTSGLTTTEGGGTATFTIALASAPLANVVINLSSSDTSEGTVSPAQVTFTTGDWSTPQTITITGQNDAIDDGNIGYTIITQGATSTDPLYSGLNASDVSVTNNDDADTAGVTVSPASASVSESGTTDTFTVVLTSQPVGNVVIDVASGDTGEATVAPAQLTFDSSDWSVPKTITITGVDDAIIDGNASTTISVTMNVASTNDALYDAIDPSDVTATTGDDDFAITATNPARNAKSVPGTTNVEATTSAIVQSSSVTQATYRVFGEFTGRISGTPSGSGTTLTFDPSSNLEPGERIHATATSGILGPNDSPLVPEVWQFIAAAGAGSGVFVAHPTTPGFGVGYSINVALGDLDHDGDLDAVVANWASDSTVWMNNGTGSFSAHPTTPVLAGIYGQDVALGDLDADGDLDAIVANTDNATGQPETVWLNDGNGNLTAHPTAATFGAAKSTSIALGDLDGDGDLDAVIANELGAAETVWLNDGAGVFTAHPTTPSFGTGSSYDVDLGDLDGDGDLDTIVTNSGGQAETVWLNDGTGAMSAHPTTPNFGAGSSYGTALGDIDGDGDLDAFVVNAFGEAETVWVNDGSGTFTAHPTMPSVGAGDGRTPALGDLDGDGDLDAVVSNANLESETVWLNDGSGVFTQHPLTAGFGAGYSYGIAVGDLDGDNDLDVVVANASGESETVWLNRNPAGVTVTPASGLATTEAGGEATFTVVLTSAPVANVVIDVSSSDVSEATVSPAQLTFTTANWATPQTVTVTGQNDNVDDGDIAYTIITAAAVSSDVLYSGFNATDVAASNTNDDTAGVDVSTPAVTVSEGGTTDTISIVVETEPAGDVVIDVSSTDTGEATVSPSQLTFTTANWATPQTVTVTGVDDAIIDGDISTTINIAMNAALTNDAVYDLIDPTDVTATTTDDDFVIVSTNPVANAKAAPRTTNVEATASGTVQPATVTSSTYRVQGEQTGRITGTYGASGTTITLDPSSSLKPGEKIHITATSTILGPNNSALVPRVWQLTAAAGAATGVFAQQGTFATNDNSLDLAMGDLDGDGDLDAVIANLAGQVETVWLNDGTGAFTAHPTTPSFGGGNTEAIVLGDLDGDGDLDALAGNDGVDEGTTVWMNDGSGSFTAHSTPKFGGTNDLVFDLGLGDLDADGDLDVVLANGSTFDDSVWLNDGTGVFTPHPVTPIINAGVQNMAIALGDIDGDGDLDLVSANTNDQAETVLVNDGTGSFSAHPTTPAFGAGKSGGIALGDLDGDGDLDAFVANGDPSQAETVWLNDGAGNFSAHPTTPSFGLDDGFDVALGDIDGDGDLDAIVANIGGGDGDTIWLNGGSANFSAHPIVDRIDSASPSPAVALGDVDGDGDLDAVFANESAAESVWINRGAAGITVAPTSGLVTTEAGGEATFTVVLTSAPVSNVVIDVSSSDAGEASVSPAQLTFTTANWATPQTVTAHGEDDDADDGDIAFTIITAAAVSTDPLYSGFNAADVSASNTDDDTAGVDVSTPAVTVSESGTTDTISIVVETEPAGDVVIDVSSTDTGEATVSPSQLTFTTANWATPQTVTVTGVDDAIIDGDISTTINVAMNAALTNDAVYDLIDPTDVTATTTDDDFVIVSTNPVANAKAAPRTTNVEATASGTVQPATVTQTSYRVQGEQTGRITGTYGASGTTITLDPSSSLKPGEKIHITATSAILGPNDSALVPRVWQFTASASVASAAMIAHPTTPSFGGTNNSIDVVLGDVDGDGDLDAIVSNEYAENDTVWANDGAGNFSALSSFDGGWYNRPATLGDLDGDGDLDAFMTGASNERVMLNNGSGVFAVHPSMPDFGGSAQSVALGDLDGDGDLDAILALFAAAESVWLNDGTGVFSAHPTAPSFGGDDSQNVALGDLDADGDLDAVVGNANGQPETVWLNDGAGVFSAHATPSFGGGGTIEVVLGDLDADGDLDALRVDNDGPETIWLNDGTGVFSQHATLSGSNVSYDGDLGDLDGDGDLDALIVDLTGTERVWLNDGSGGFSPHPAVPSFTSGQSTAVALGDIDGDGDLDAVLANSGSAASVWINRPVPGITVTPTSGLTTTEAGGEDTFTVVLTSQPVADVVIDVSSSDTSEATVSPSQLTFTNANWSTPQTVTITGVDDALDDGNVAYTITNAPAVSTDPLYSGLNAADVSATNNDDGDTAGVTVASGTLSVSESGTTATFTVVLDSEPAGNVVIDVSSTDTTEATVSPSQLTFTNANWSTPQTVTITGVDDALDDGDQTTTIAVTMNAAATNDPLYDAIDPSDVTVTTVDDDAPFGAPPNFLATATGTSTVATSWTPVAGATNYEVWRTTSIGIAYTLVNTTTNTSFNDSGLSASTTYLYKVRANGSGGPSAFSAVDPATTIVFTDPVLTTSTTIKAVHVTQLRTAVNAMRAAAQLGAASFTDPAPVTIKRIHIIELRTALDDARAAIGLAALIYTDPTITAGTTKVKREHIAEPRAGTQ